jgi:hypothetical protein
MLVVGRAACKPNGNPDLDAALARWPCSVNAALLGDEHHWAKFSRKKQLG